jgi:glycosyltransferase involved in cell wall biosynthesis
MKIAIFTDTFLPSINGVVTSIVNLSRELVKKGHNVMIITSITKKKSKIDLGKNISIVRYKTLGLIKYPDFQLTAPNPFILNKVRDFKTDVIHSHMPSLLGWQALVCSKIFNVPIVGTYQTFLPGFVDCFPILAKFKNSFVQDIIWGYTKMYYNACDKITTLSHAMKDELIKNNIKSVDVVSDGVDLNNFYPRDTKKDGKTILQVGRISCEKNVDVTVRAFKILLKNIPDAKLIIAGSGPDLKKIKEMASDCKNIKLLGAVDHEKLPKIYSKADLFVTASTIEVEGLVILEAMACGLPIVGVDALAIPTIVAHEKNGFIAKPYNEEEIAKYMFLLLNKKELRQSFGKKSTEIVKKYSLEKTADKFEKIYKLLIDKR